MGSGYALQELDSVDVSNQIDLRKFAPKLRKLGKFLLQADQPTTIKAACDKLKLNYTSVCTLIWKEKRKGNDFHQFIREISQSMLNMSRAAVYQATINGAVSDSSTAHNDRKLFLQLAGDLKETPSVNIGSLTLGINISNVLIDPDVHKKGVIDIAPMIPKN